MNRKLLFQKVFYAGTPKSWWMKENYFITIALTMPSNLISPLNIDQPSNKSLVLSSRQMGWNGILVEQYQNYSPTSSEFELPALSDHWLNLPLGQPVHLIQKRGDHVHESIVQKGDSILISAGQPSYWHCGGSDTYQPILHIHLKPESIAQVAETSEVNKERIELVNCFSKHDLHIQNIAMLLLAELKSGGMMGQLYVESLTQVLAIHLLRHYCAFTQPITSKNR